MKVKEMKVKKNKKVKEKKRRGREGEWKRGRMEVRENGSEGQKNTGRPWMEGRPV